MSNIRLHYAKRAEIIAFTDIDLIISLVRLTGDTLKNVLLLQFRIQLLSTWGGRYDFKWSSQFNEEEKNGEMKKKKKKLRNPLNCHDR